MKADCRWFGAHLEAYFCEDLGGEELNLAKEHLQTCLGCRNELQALHDVDPVIKQVMEYRLAIARSTTTNTKRNRGVRFGIASAVLAGAAVLGFVIFFHDSSPPNVAAPEASTTTPGAVASAVDNAKGEDALAARRLKPDAPSTTNTAVRPAADPVIVDNAPEFLVIDPEGHSSTLQDFKGRLLIVGIWSAEHPEAIENLQKLYQAFGTRRDVRVLAVSRRRESRPAGTTFPMVFNDGSRLLETRTANYVVLDKDGLVQMRGSLNGDTAALVAKVRSRLDELGGK